MVCSGGDSRNASYTCWCLLDEHACAIGSLRLNLASVSVHKLWTTTDLRPKPCFEFLQSRMGLAVRKHIATVKDDQDFLPSALASSLSSSSMSGPQGEDSMTSTPPPDLAFIRFFSKLNNLYAFEDDRKSRADVWCFVSHNDLRPFAVPADYYKASVV